MKAKKNIKQKISKQTKKLSTYISTNVSFYHEIFFSYPIWNILQLRVPTDTPRKPSQKTRYSMHSHTPGGQQTIIFLSETNRSLLKAKPNFIHIWQSWVKVKNIMYANACDALCSHVMISVCFCLTKQSVSDSTHTFTWAKHS